MAVFPQDFLDSIAAILPDKLKLEDFVHYSRLPLRRSIRVNTLKISVEDFVVRMSKQGWSLEPVPWCAEGFWLRRQDESVPLGSTIEHLAGLYYIQEASSMLPVLALFAGEHAPERVLDVASAPGSKTTQIAARMQNNGAVVANEFSSSRIKGLYSNLQRLGIRNVALTHFDGAVFGSCLPESFDAILLDAPCSGEGTVRKDPDALTDWGLEPINAVAQVQQKLIESAFAALKPDGRLIYSTCTLNHIENQQVCQFLKESYPEQVEFEPLSDLFEGAVDAVTPEGFLHVWPQIYDSEGFFVASIRKTGSIEYEQKKPRLGRFPFSPAKSAKAAQLSSYLTSQLGCQLPSSGQLMARDNELWWFPAQVEALIGQIRMDRIGIKLVEEHKKGFKTLHEAVMALPFDQDKAFSLTREQAIEYLMGRDIALNSPNGKGEVIVSYDGYPLGLAKWVGKKLKNNLPRELVRDRLS